MLSITPTSHSEKIFGNFPRGDRKKMGTGGGAVRRAPGQAIHQRNTTMKTKHAIRSLAPAGLLLASCLLPSHHAAAADVVATWNGTTGNWNDSTKWSSALFPDNGNGGFTYDAIQNAGTVTVNLAIIIEKYTFSSGTNTGAGLLKMNDVFTWTGGTMSGAGVVNANGGVSFAGSTKILTGGRVLNLGASSTWTAGGIQIGNGGVINNQAGVTFTNSFDGGMALSGSGPATFNNAGTFTKSAGAGTTSVGAPWPLTTPAPSMWTAAR